MNNISGEWQVLCCKHRYKQTADQPTLLIKIKVIKDKILLFFNSDFHFRIF